MVHAAMAALQPGEVLVLSMPEPAPVALVGDLLATQAKVHGAAAILVDASVRDLEELVELGLPIWARYVRIRGAVKETPGELDVPVEIGGATINPGDIVVLDADGAAVVERDRVAEVLEGALKREENERVKRAKLQGGALSYDLDGLREIVGRHGGVGGPWVDRAAARDRAHQPRRAADAQGRGEPALLRRRPRDGDRGARGAVGLPARLGRLPALLPEADRVRHLGHGPHGPAHLEPRGARAPRRPPSRRRGSGWAGARATSATAPRTAAPIRTAMSSSCSTRSSATARRPSSCPR